jgi:hypothetical protein
MVVSADSGRVSGVFFRSWRACLLRAAGPPPPRKEQKSAQVVERKRLESLGRQKSERRRLNGVAPASIDRKLEGMTDFRANMLQNQEDYTLVTIRTEFD